MNSFHDQRLWDVAQLRHAALRQEAENARIAKMAMSPKQSWWATFFQRLLQAPARQPSAVPEVRTLHVPAYK